MPHKKKKKMMKENEKEKEEKEKKKKQINHKLYLKYSTRFGERSRDPSVRSQ